MVDFARLLAESQDPDRVRSGTVVEGPWPEQGVAFRVRRGTFRLDRALAADEVALRSAIAQRLPPADMGKLVVTTMPEHDELVVRWRVIRVVAA